VPKPTFGFREKSGSSVSAGGGRGRVRVSMGGKCFARVIQPGRNFGNCISRALLQEKGLLK
jgi:hypothetical protein